MKYFLTKSHRISILRTNKLKLPPTIFAKNYNLCSLKIKCSFLCIIIYFTNKRIECSLVNKGKESRFGFDLQLAYLLHI